MKLGYDCDAKVRFSTYALADKARGRRATRTVYHCRSCGFFHVGKNAPQSVRKGWKRPRVEA